MAVDGHLFVPLRLDEAEGWQPALSCPAEKAVDLFEVAGVELLHRRPEQILRKAVIALVAGKAGPGLAVKQLPVDALAGKYVEDRPLCERVGIAEVVRPLLPIVVHHAPEIVALVPIADRIAGQRECAIAVGLRRDGREVRIRDRKAAGEAGGVAAGRLTP